MPTNTLMTHGGIAYDDHGSGDACLLFMPGWCGPRTIFEPLVTRLARSCRTLAVDWRGHGGSAPAVGEFGLPELVDDAVSVIDASGAETVIPVGVAHAGWVAIELRRRLGATRIPKLVLLDWMVLGAAPPFLDALAAMADPVTTRAVVDQISAMWRAGLDLPALDAYVDSMVAFPDEMWRRAAGAIAAAFEREGSPLDAVARLDVPPSTLHLYAQPPDPEFLVAQQTFATVHPWLTVERLEAASHFPMFEVPDTMTERIGGFIAG